MDVLADYRLLFGTDPPDALALAVMTDTDDTCTVASAWLAGFEFNGGGGSDG